MNRDHMHFPFELLNQSNFKVKYVLLLTII